ncbi:hypothetical protein EAJ17_00180 [Akkermansia sp. aa_0143]|jgi:hypothetical protein|nr:hypothetical protein EAJ17_00180 [Akkermansia sp. aa_0143]
MMSGNVKKSFSGSYPTRAEFSGLLKTGVLLTAAGTLMSCGLQTSSGVNASPVGGHEKDTGSCPDDHLRRTGGEFPAAWERRLEK